MITDAFTTAARDLGVDPEEVRASVGNAFAHHLKVGMSDEEVLMWCWHAGTIYGRDHLARQEATDAGVLAAARAVRDADDDGCVFCSGDPHPCLSYFTYARAALTAAKEARTH